MCSSWGPGWTSLALLQTPEPHYRHPGYIRTLRPGMSLTLDLGEIEGSEEFAALKDVAVVCLVHKPPNQSAHVPDMSPVTGR